MNAYNSKFLIFGNAKFYKKKGGNNHLISVIFSPHFTEYIYYAIALYRYLCNKHAIGSSSGNQTIASF